MQRRAEQELNVLWLVCDTLRADRLGCYGYFRNTSPTIDRLAAEGVLFEDYYCSALSTGAAFSCLLTGLPSIKHRYYATPADAFNLMNFDDTIPTLAEIVQSNGSYTTVALDNLVNFGGHMKQTVRGFEYYINVTHQSGFPHPEYTAEELNARFLPWLQSHSREKFFAFIHFWDTHQAPYRCPGYRDRFYQPEDNYEGLPVRQAPAGYKYVPAWGRVGEIVWGQSLKDRYGYFEVDGGVGSVEHREGKFDLSHDLYDCSVAYLDNQIQRILDTLSGLGILDKTMIVLTADHGEGLGNHGIWGHGLPYDDTIHIPLILWRPGYISQGHRVKGFAQHIDVAPTMLDLMGIGDGGTPIRVLLGAKATWRGGDKGVFAVRMEGASLLPHMRGERAGHPYTITEVRRGPSDPGYRVMMQSSWKLIEKLAGQRQLYDLTFDPMEKVNLASQETGRTEQMSKALADWVAAHLAEGESDPMRIWPLPK